MTLKGFFETFNLALGILVALILGAIGAFLLYVAWSLWDGVFWIGVIGGGLVFLSLLMLIWRVTFLRILELFSYSSWN